jgi:hypothetical protein
MGRTTLLSIVAVAFAVVAFAPARALAQDDDDGLPNLDLDASRGDLGFRKAILGGEAVRLTLVNFARLRAAGIPVPSLSPILGRVDGVPGGLVAFKPGGVLVDLTDPGVNPRFNQKTLDTLDAISRTIREHDLALGETPSRHPFNFVLTPEGDVFLLPTPKTVVHDPGDGSRGSERFMARMDHDESLRKFKADVQESMAKLDEAQKAIEKALGFQLSPDDRLAVLDRVAAGKTAEEAILEGLGLPITSSQRAQLNADLADKLGGDRDTNPPSSRTSRWWTATMADAWQAVADKNAELQQKLFRNGILKAPDSVVPAEGGPREGAAGILEREMTRRARPAEAR